MGNRFTIRPMLGAQVGLQYAGLIDESEAQISQVGMPIIIGYFSRGTPFNVVEVTKTTLDAVLGYSPNNLHYIQVKSLLDQGISPVQVLNLGTYKNVTPEPEIPTTPTPQPEPIKPTTPTENPKPTTPIYNYTGYSYGSGYGSSGNSPLIVDKNSPDYPSGGVDGFYDSSLSNRIFIDALWSPNGDRLAVLEANKYGYISLVIFEFDVTTKTFTEYPKFTPISAGYSFTKDTLKRAVFSYSGKTLICSEFTPSNTIKANNVTLLMFDLKNLNNISSQIKTIATLQDTLATARPINLAIYPNDKILISTYFGKSNLSTEQTCFELTLDERGDHPSTIMQAMFGSSDYGYGIATNELQWSFVYLNKNAIYLRYYGATSWRNSMFDMEQLGVGNQKAQGVFNLGGNKFFINFATGDLATFKITYNSNDYSWSINTPDVLRDVGDIEQVCLLPSGGLAVNEKGAKKLYLEDDVVKALSIPVSNAPEILKVGVVRKINPKYPNYLISVANNKLYLHSIDGTQFTQYQPKFKKAL